MKYTLIIWKLLNCKTTLYQLCYMTAVKRISLEASPTASYPTCFLHCCLQTGNTNILCSVLLLVLQLLDSLGAECKDFLFVYILGHNKRCFWKSKSSSFFFFFLCANMYLNWVNWMGCGGQLCCMLKPVPKSECIKFHSHSEMQCIMPFFHPNAVLHFTNGVSLENREDKQLMK